MKSSTRRKLYRLRNLAQDWLGGAVCVFGVPFALLLWAVALGLHR